MQRHAVRARHRQAMRSVLRASRQQRSETRSASGPARLPPARRNGAAQVSPATKLLLIAAVITVGGAWWGWWIIRPKKPLPPPVSDERDSLSAWWRNWRT